MKVKKGSAVLQLVAGAIGLSMVVAWAGVFLPDFAAQDARPRPVAIESKKTPDAPPSGEHERAVQPSPTRRTSGAGASKSESYPASDWVYDARWYYIDVPRFYNGDKSNDPPGTVEWTAQWPVRDDPRFSTISSHTAAAGRLVGVQFGGDIKGVTDHLGYVKELGINAIILGGLFNHGWGLGFDPQRIFRIRERELRYPEQDFNPGPNPSELALSELIEESHRQGIRVALAYPYAYDEYWAFPNVDDAPVRSEGLKRWFDLDGDGDPSDAIDAVWISHPLFAFDYGERANVFGRKLAAVNPSCVIFGSCHGCTKLEFSSFFGIIPSAINSDGGRLVRWIQDKTASDEGIPRINSCQPVSTTELVMLANPAARVRPDEDRRMRDRLALILHHFGTGSPVTLYGDEVGIMRGTGVWGNPPMWWNDLPDPKTKSPDYRGDFFALVQWLHHMRAEHKPLRRGGFRLVLNDAENKIFAFARTLPGDEVVLVMNYGDKKQKVMLPAGKPGQMVVALTPMIDPSKSRLAKLTKGKYDHTKIAPLPVGGSRAFVNKDGKVRLWVDAMSIRVVLVNDKEPRRR